MNRPQSHAHPIDPLASTRLQVSITDLVAAYELRHEFRNDRQEPIEAVFSFPVPLDAAFLGMHATLAGEKLEARVVPACDASQEYDDAIADGDSAVLVQTPEPGLLCVNLGNLKPGECGDVVLRFATLVAVADRVARFSIPLVNRPRYGRWNLEELETPTHDFAAEHAISAVVEVRGLLSGLPVTSTAHAARFEQHGGVMTLSLEHAMLDRDIVLTFQLQEDLASTGRLIEVDGEAIGMVTLAPSATDVPAASLDLCLLLDCSGSMTGDAIMQSRQALRAIADALTEQDTIQVIRFGSTTSPLFRRPLKATERVRVVLSELARTVESDLGGTEMGEAITRALNQLAARKQADRSAVIVLVTDGAVQPRDVEEAQDAALEMGVRIFVVAVGSSAGVEVLAPVANVTGGVLERVMPAESIDETVMRHFRRARQPVPIRLVMSSPKDAELIGCPAALYAGDAATFFARVPKATDEVRFQADDGARSVQIQQGDTASSPAIHALYGAALYRQVPEQDRKEVALRFSLLTKETSAVLVKHRLDDKVEELPVIVAVTQMVPHGMVDRSSYEFASASRAVATGEAACLRRVTEATRHSASVACRPTTPSQPTPFEVELLPEIAAERVRHLLLRLVRILQQAQEAGENLTLRESIERLSADEREEATMVAEHVFHGLTDKEAMGLVALVLEMMGDYVSDDLEASLALASKGSADRLSILDGGRVRSVWFFGLPARTRRRR